MKKSWLVLIVLAAAAGIGIYAYREYQKAQEMKYPKFYSGNGRLEATEVYISSRLADRIEKIYVNAGSLVKPGDKLVQMRTATLEAQRAATIARIKVQKGELGMAQATVQQKESAFKGAEKEYKRQKTMVTTGAASKKNFDDAETAYNKAIAEKNYALASVLSAQGKIAEQEAELKQIEADIHDSLLVAPVAGRVQYKLAQTGEVLSAGGRALNLVDLTDVYMTFFLPTKIAGLVQMGAEVKLVFDAAPDDPVPAKVDFIDPVAQFTPKSVETKVEREKLMFRIKARVDARVLQKYIEDIKTGIPGTAWVKIDPKASWEEAPLPVLRKALQANILSGEHKR